MLRGRSGSQCGSYTLSVGHIHLVWVIHTRVSNIHSVLVTYTRCWSYTLGVGQIHTVGVVYIHSCWSYTHAGFGLYTLGVGHIHSVWVIHTRSWSYTLSGFGLYALGVDHIHSVLVVYTRCESYLYTRWHKRASRAAQKRFPVLEPLQPACTVPEFQRGFDHRKGDMHFV